MVDDDYTFGRQRYCWGRRTALEKVFIVFFSILVVAFIAVGTLIWTQHINVPYITEPKHMIEHHASPPNLNSSSMHRQYLNPARLVMLEKTIETVTENGQKTIVVPVTPPSITENTASMQHQISKSDFIVTEVETKERIIENYEIKTEPTIHPINICETEGCKSAIEQIHSFYDPTIDPCDDFYQFACGGYVNKTQIPADQVSVNVFSEILDILLVQLQTLISEPIRVDETKPFRLAKQLYSACLNESLLEERGTGPLLAIASRFGGWPVLFGEDQWVHEENWNWLQMNMDLRDGGFPFDTIFGLSVQTDLMNSSIRTLDIDQSSLGLNREYLIQGFDNEHVQNYFMYMVDVAVALGANRTNGEQQLKEALQFEIEIAKIGLPNEERRNASALHNPMSIGQLQTLYPYIPWIEYINSILPDNLNVTEEQIVVNTVPTFFASLADLLKITPKKTLANYLVWRTVEFMVFYSTKQLRYIQQEFNRVENGQLEIEQRWKECIDVVSSNLPISLSALYVRKFFNEKSKLTADEMVKNIREAFNEILDKVQWMDEETLSYAKHKLAKMTTHIGYPDELGNDAILDQYYAGLDIDSELYLESVLNVNTFQTNYTLGQLRDVVNKTDWVEHSNAATFGASYRSIENSIQFPAGILQGRFFSVDRPSYMNYGAIGFVIGHEITHGFDDKGRQFDDSGNVKVWWQKDTADRYLEKADCIVEQYGNFTDQRTLLKINGLKTEGENIADNGGIKIAYAAYQRWVAVHPVEPILPDRTWNQSQYFWLSAAQSWCNVITQEHLEQIITTDPHSPFYLRVLGSFQNSQEFAADFQCPIGSRMNPVHKCGVW